MSFFIDVILPIPLQKLFTYSITAAEAHFIKIGMRVSVPFGKSKIYTGIVYAIHENAPLIYEAKEIHQILDEVAIVTHTQIELWDWISSYYMCTLGDVMRAALPSAFILESETVISKNSSATDSPLSLTDNEFLVYEALQLQPELKINDILNILGVKSAFPIINKLLEKGIITIEEEVTEKYIPKLVRYVKLHPHYTTNEDLQELLKNLERAKQQHKVILTLFSLSATTKKPIKISDLSKSSEVSVAIIKTLIDKNILEEYHIQEDRLLYSGEEVEALKQLNEHQDIALKAINLCFKTQQVALLHGVTASGKTEVYIRLIESAINNKAQVLYLLPEIALTTQLIGRLQNYFGDKVSVFHSKYTSNERVEVWHKVLNSSPNAQIVIGARSSVFLPFQNLKLIIVDEEHEQSFKQFDRAPRYHARDTALVLAHLHQAKTVLGSATPSLESYHNALQKKYGLVELMQRHNNILMPEIELINVQDKLKRKLMTGHFSDTLISEMRATLQAKQQVILFQNRRGFAPIVACNTCGHSPQCPNCDVSLTHHAFIKQLRCHYCGYHMPMLETCLACHSPDLDSKGFGTEQVEEEVKTLFPDYKVARMDLDTTRAKNAYQKLFSDLEQQNIDILVGTQMLTKGLDFRNVKLVGILNADNLLNFPDFRAHERSFQLIIQVAGRAGRTQEQGKVLVQTYNPQHPILQQVITNNYLGMYHEQMIERHDFKYPPYVKQIKITLKHKDNYINTQASNWYAKSLRQYIPLEILGPEAPPVSRIRNQYHKNILIKIPKDKSVAQIKGLIIKINNSFLSIKEFRSVKVIFNVDNY